MLRAFSCPKDYTAENSESDVQRVASTGLRDENTGIKPYLELWNAKNEVSWMGEDNNTAFGVEEGELISDLPIFQPVFWYIA